MIWLLDIQLYLFRIKTGTIGGSYIQKNGDKVSSGSNLGSPNDIGYGGEDGTGYTSVQDFFNKYKNDPRNPGGQGNDYYTEAYVMPTSSSQDQKIISGMKQKLYEQYHFTQNNCGHAVSFALHNAGIKSKPSMTLRIISIGASVLFRNPSYIMADIKANATIPKRIYGNIVRANPEGKIIKP